MGKAALSSSRPALPARVSLWWGASLLEVRVLAPGSHWRILDLRVDASAHGTRVVLGDEVLLAAGPGERAQRDFGWLTLRLDPTGEVERITGGANDLEVPFFKITAMALLAFGALIASFELTPSDDLSDGESVFTGSAVPKLVKPPAEIKVARAPRFDQTKPRQPRTPQLLEPARPRRRAVDKVAADKDRVQKAIASLFGGPASSVFERTGLGAGLNDHLEHLGRGAPGPADVSGLGGLGVRRTGAGGPAGDGLTIGTLGSPRAGHPTGFTVGDGHKRVFQPAPGPTQVVGDGLDKAVVMSVIRRHQSEIKFCYERELQQHQSLAGKVAVTWTIDGTGGVQEAQVAESGLDNANVEACMLERIRRWRFPEPRGGGVVVITFPWVFNAAGGAEE